MVFRQFNRRLNLLMQCFQTCNRSLLLIGKTRYISHMGLANVQISLTLSEIKRDFPMEFPFFDSKT